jgi:hypothetical protein
LPVDQPGLGRDGRRDDHAVPHARMRHQQHLCLFPVSTQHAVIDAGSGTPREVNAVAGHEQIGADGECRLQDAHILTVPHLLHAAACHCHGRQRRRAVLAVASIFDRARPELLTGI